MMGFRNLFFILIVWNTTPVCLYAYRVYPTIAQNEKMFDKNNYPFIAENADGFNLQHDSFAPFSADQVALIFKQFRNKNFINHGIFKSNVAITKMATMNKKPSFANVTAFMLYNEAPAMNAGEWAEALKQEVDWPLITHCRSYNDTKSFDAIRKQILATSGIMMEFQVTNEAKYDDAAKLLMYCVDHKKNVVFLTTFQQTPEVYSSAYQSFFYYLKKNINSKYLASDHLIFVPNCYQDSQVFPETSGYGSTFGIAHWLIDQKSKIFDGYIQPQIVFSSLKENTFFPNHSNLTINIDVKSATAVQEVKLYLGTDLVGANSTAPYTWKGGKLDNLTTGYKELKAVVQDHNGIVTTKAIQIRILEPPPVIPGFFKASQCSDFKTRNAPDAQGYFRHVFGGEWIDYQLNVAHEGIYDIDISLFVQKSKQFGGTISLFRSDELLGSYTTILNEPSQKSLSNFTETPKASIHNVNLKAGLQTLRFVFSHPDGIVKPQFYVNDFNFKIQGAPAITVTQPSKVEGGTYSNYDAPASLFVAANVRSTRTKGTIAKVTLYCNDKEISPLFQPPFEWNKENSLASLNKLPKGDYIFKIVATDELNYESFEQFDIKVIDRLAFNNSLKIPGTIKAWQYDLGGEGIGYHDFNEGIEGGLEEKKNPRYIKTVMEDVEVEKSDSDYCVSAIRNGEWLNYTISEVRKGNYDIVLTLAANTGKNGDVKIILDNKVIAIVPFDETGTTFDNYKEFKITPVNITENIKNANLRLEFVNPSIKTYLCFLKQFEFKMNTQNK